MVETSDIVLIIIAIIFPPVATAILTGLSIDLLINVLLTFLGFIPGHVHVFWLLYLYMKSKEEVHTQSERPAGKFYCASHVSKLVYFIIELIWVGNSIHVSPDFGRYGPTFRLPKGPAAAAPANSPPKKN